MERLGRFGNTAVPGDRCERHELRERHPVLTETDINYRNRVQFVSSAELQRIAPRECHAILKMYLTDLDH